MDSFAALPVVVLQQLVAMVDGQYVTSVVPSTPSLPRQLFATLRLVSRDWRRLVDSLVELHHVSTLHVRLCGDVSRFPRQIEALVETLQQRTRDAPALRAMAIRVGTDEFVRSFEILKARAYDDAFDGVAVNWQSLFAACPRLQRLDLSGLPLHSRHLREILDAASLECPDLLALELPRKEWHRGQVSMVWRPTFDALLLALERWHTRGSQRGLLQLTVPQRITKCDTSSTTIHSLTDEYLYALAAFCPNLQHLDGWKSTYTESEGRLGCEELLFSSRGAWTAFCQSCTQLCELNWFVLPFIDDFFKAFAASPKPNLKRLVLAGGDHVNFGQDAVFGTYYTDGTWSYSNQGLAALFRGCPALEELDVLFQFTPFDDAGRHDIIDDDFLIALATHCPRLKRLEIKELNNASFYGSLKGISDRGVAALATLRELRVVSLKDTKCESQGLLELIRHAPREGPPRVVDMIVGGYELVRPARRQEPGNFYSVISDVLLAVHQHPLRLDGRRFTITLKGLLRGQPLERHRQLWKGSTMMLIDALRTSSQVELHGHYSLERLIDMTRYSDHVSFLRALFPIVMAVVPTIIMVSTIDLLPLEAPSLGLSHSRNFWIRSACGTFCITVSALEVHHRVIPVLRRTLWQLLVWCVFITAGMTAGTIGMAHAIGFPLPFQFHIVVPMYGVFVTIAVAVLWGRFLLRNPRVMEEVQAFQVMFGTLTLCTFIYPAYNYAFVSLDGHAQAAFALLLPVVKLIVKNVVAPFCKHMEDMKPGEVIFNVEIFHALFTSYCMQVEFVVLTEFTEVIIPVIYCVFITAASRNANAEFYPQVRGLTNEDFVQQVGRILIYASLEFISFLVLCWLLHRKLRFAVIKQLAFVLESDWHARSRVCPAFLVSGMAISGATERAAVSKGRRILAWHLFVLLVLCGLDVRDLHYKLEWLGPEETFSFRTGVHSVLHASPLVQRAIDGDPVSGWPGFLSSCSQLRALGMNDGQFFLCAMGLNCTVASDANGTRLVPQLVMTSDMRVDALLWSACALLFYDRRPPICHETIVTAFYRRYAFADSPHLLHPFAPIGSTRERELLRFLSFLSQSAPLRRVICVEAFELPVNASGAFDATVYGCASPNLNRSEWVGFVASEIYDLAHDKGWLTNDVLSLMGTKYTIRQNAHSIFSVFYDANGRTIVDSRVRVNFSSNGPLYALVIVIDGLLLVGRFAKIQRDDLSHRRQKAQYSDSSMTGPDGPWVSSAGDATGMPRGNTHRRLLARRFANFNEVEFYSIFSRPLYRSDHVAVMRTVTQLLSWLIILPNSVVWTWSDSMLQKAQGYLCSIKSDSMLQKAQGYLCSIKSWVLITMSINAIWGVIVKFDEPRAYRFVSRTRLDKLEIVVIGAAIAFLQRKEVFSICEIKWASEGQRVNDGLAFEGGYVAHGNTFNPDQDDVLTTPLSITWIVFSLSHYCDALAEWSGNGATPADATQVVSRRRPTYHTYHRLALEVALDSPIRALSLIRSDPSLDVAQHDRVFVSPSRYLDSGVLRSDRRIESRVSIAEILRWSPSLADSMIASQRHVDVASMSKIIRRMSPLYWFPSVTFDEQAKMAADATQSSGRAGRRVVVMHLLLVLGIFALDARDLQYKLYWLGPEDSFSFRAGSTSVLNPTPLRADISALNQSDAMGVNCAVADGVNGTQRRISQLLMTSDARVDSLAWAACSLLFIARRPPICHENMVADFRERYAFRDKPVARQDIAPPGSAAERELLRFLELLSLSDPLGHVICVEAFELPVGAVGTFDARIYGCASPNLYRSEWVGFEATAMSTLQGDKAWLTNDVLSIVGLKFGIRQNTQSRFVVSVWKNTDGVSRLAVTSQTRVNFSSYGPLYALIIMLDLTLLVAHFFTTMEIVKWISLPQYSELQEWMYDFENSDDAALYSELQEWMYDFENSDDAALVAPQSVHQSFIAQSLTSPKSPSKGRVRPSLGAIPALIIKPRRISKQEGSPPPRRRMTRSFAVTMQRFPTFARLMTAAVEFDEVQFYSFFSRLKCWILIATCVELLWKAVVRLDETRAYHFVRYTYVTNAEIIVIGALVALLERDHIFSICEIKWGAEGQRVNEVDAFLGGFIAHGNTYNQSQDHVSTTPLSMLWVVYAPLLRIVLLSVVMIGAVLILKFVYYYSRSPQGRRWIRWLRRPRSVRDSTRSEDDERTRGNGDGERYRRLPLEEALGVPIRATSLIRNRLSMEIVKGGKTFIRPSCYLEFGALLKNGRIESKVHIADIGIDSLTTTSMVLPGQMTRSSALKGRRTMLTQLVIIVSLFALDARDLHYKLQWLGPMDSYSFRAGSTSILHAKPLEPLVTARDAADAHGVGATGWPSFLSRCERLHAMGAGGGPFFLSAMGINCTIPVGFNATRVVPQLVMTSDARVDSLVWAACSLLFIARRPPICHEDMVVGFLRRYAFPDQEVDTVDVALPGSPQEIELLRFLDVVSSSDPLSRVICVEAFELPVGISGMFEAPLYGCASPNLYRSEWIGFEATAVFKLQSRKGWLTNDVLSLIGLKFGIRQNTYSRFKITYEDTQTVIESFTTCNFSSYGPLYATVIAIDIVLLVAHFMATYELLKWIFLPKYYELQAWIQDFESSSQPRLTAPLSIRRDFKASSRQVTPVVPPALKHNPSVQKPNSSDRIHPTLHSGTTFRRPALMTLDEDEQVEFEEVQFYSFFSRSFYRNHNYVLLTTVTQLLSWPIILPNSVVWTWSDSLLQKVQGYLCSLKTWVLIATSLNTLWSMVVKLDERRAYNFVRYTFITNPEIIGIGALVAFLEREYIFSICEIKWSKEIQRVNDLAAFKGGYIAHGNTYNKAHDYVSTTPLAVLWVLYGPLVRIVGYSVMACVILATLKFVVFYLRVVVNDDGLLVLEILKSLASKLRAMTRILYGVTPDAKRSQQGTLPDSTQQEYHRLALEEALDAPIRATSLIRNRLSMEVMKNGRTYIRPSCYLDFGIMLKSGRIESRVDFNDIFRLAQTRPMGSAALVNETPSNAEPLKVMSPEDLSPLGRAGEEQAVDQCRIISCVHAGLDSIDALTRDVSGAEQFVEQMNLFGNRLTTMDGLQRFTGLVELCLSNNLIELLPGLELLDEEDTTVLEELSRVSMPKYTSAGEEQAVDRCRIISCVHGGLDSIDALTRDVSGAEQFVEQMNLFGNRLTAMDGLQRFTGLVELCLSNNLIELLPGLELLDEEDTTVLEELSRVSMPKYTSLEQAQRELDEKNRQLDAAQSQARQELQASTQRSRAETEALQQHATSLEQQLRALEESNRQHIQQREARHSELLQTIERLQSERHNDSIALRAAEHRAQQQQELREESERRRQEQDNVARTRQRELESRLETLTRQLADATSALSDSESRYQTLDRQLRELHSRHEQLRHDSLQRDDELYRTRKAMQAKQAEVDDVKALLVKSAERQDRLQQQQQQWYNKQLQATVLQLELEFRREREAAQRKYQTALQQTARFKSAYEASLQRETQLKDEAARLRAAIADDQRKLLQQDEAMRAGFELRLQRLEDEKQALRDELALAQDKLTAIPALQRETDSARAATDKQRAEVERCVAELAASAQRESDFKAALKVKDVMLDDQLRQIEELRHSQRELERDAQEWQAQVEDLEAALDDHIQRLSEAEGKANELQSELERARDSLQEMDSERALLTEQLERKDTALAVIEREMERLRAALSNQEELLERRLQKRLERHHEAAELDKLAGEEERGRLVGAFERTQQLDKLAGEEERGRLVGAFERTQRQWQARYQQVVGELQAMATQTKELRAALASERSKNAQTDQEMRVLLAQIDRERQVKKQSLRHIKSLFDELQQETP
ncbi:hypothetical protein ATCC90586_006885 [Pythium insidiosum]|nr:hypothetical protein ATCC90586_006885 [Pythium insidiosum]